MVFIADYLWPQHDNLISILNSPSVSGHGTADTAGLVKTIEKKSLY